MSDLVLDREEIYVSPLFDKRKVVWWAKSNAQIYQLEKCIKVEGIRTKGAFFIFPWGITPNKGLKDGCLIYTKWNSETRLVHFNIFSKYGEKHDVPVKEAVEFIYSVLFLFDENDAQFDGIRLDKVPPTALGQLW